MNFKYHLINITFGVAILTTAGLANSVVKESFLMGGALGVLTLAIIDWYASWRNAMTKTDINKAKRDSVYFVEHCTNFGRLNKAQKRFLRWLDSHNGCAGLKWRIRL